MSIRKGAIRVLIEFTSPLLGSLPSLSTQKEMVLRSLLKERRKLEEELKKKESEEIKRNLEELEKKIKKYSVEDKEAAMINVFARDENGWPVILAYQIMGMLKEAAHNFSDIRGARSKIQKFVRVSPYVVNLYDPKENVAIDDIDGILWRPVRVARYGKEYTTLKGSEIINLPIMAEFTIEIVQNKKNPFTREGVVELLERGGEFLGLLGWRSGGYGRFRIVDVK